MVCRVHAPRRLPGSYVALRCGNCALCYATPHVATWRPADGIYFVLTETKAQHPWAKYYNERGIARPNVVEIVRSPAASRPQASAVMAAPGAPEQSELSPELAAAVAAVSPAAGVWDDRPANTAAPFITAMQREASARTARQAIRTKRVKFALTAAACLVAVHFVATRIFCTAPAEEAVLAHVQSLPEAVLPFFSTSQQPLQADGVAITQADQIDSQHFRYVATVTLRLRKPLYIPAMTNGTANYRRLQEALQHAREQDLKFKLFADSDAEPVATLPLLLQQVHQAGETVIVRVPFTARRFGWRWRIDQPQLGLRIANRVLQGSSLDRYEAAPYLIFGGPATLTEIRQRSQGARDYVVAVAKEVQRRSAAVAVAPARPSMADAPAQLALADRPAQQSLADLPAQSVDLEGANKVAQAASRPAIDPDAPAVSFPSSAKFFSAPPRTAAR